MYRQSFNGSMTLPVIEVCPHGGSVPLDAQEKAGYAQQGWAGGNNSGIGTVHRFHSVSDCPRPYVLISGTSPTGMDLSEFSGEYADTSSPQCIGYSGECRPVYKHNSNSEISLRYIYHPMFGNVWQFHRQVGAVAFDDDEGAIYSVNDLFLRSHAFLPVNIRRDTKALQVDCTSASDPQKFSWGHCHEVGDHAEFDIQCSAKQDPPCTSHHNCFVTGYCENGKCKDRWDIFNEVDCTRNWFQYDQFQAEQPHSATACFIFGQQSDGRQCWCEYDWGFDTALEAAKSVLKMCEQKCEEQKGSCLSECGLVDVDMIPFTKSVVHAINGVPANHSTAYIPSISCQIRNSTHDSLSDCSSAIDMNLTGRCFTVNAKQKLVFQSTKGAVLKLEWASIFRWPSPEVEYSMITLRAKGEEQGDQYIVGNKEMLFGKIHVSTVKKYNKPIQTTYLMNPNTISWKVHNTPWYSDFGFQKWSGSHLQIQPATLVVDHIKEEKTLQFSDLAGTIGGLWTFAALILGFLFKDIEPIPDPSNPNAGRRKLVKMRFFGLARRLLSKRSGSSRAADDADDDGTTMPSSAADDDGKAAASESNPFSTDAYYPSNVSKAEGKRIVL